MNRLSVRTYKRLIVGTVGLIFIVLACLCVYFYFQMCNTAEQVAVSEKLLEETQLHFSQVEKKLQEYESSPLYSAELFDYQKLYPDMVAEKTEKKEETQEKVVYLTFDDGPSVRTPEVLDILDRYGIKATFFVVYYNTAKVNDLYRDIVARGHTIGVHSTTHQMTKIYKSVESYLEDFKTMYDHIYAQTGVKVQLFRFSGGSINSYNTTVYNSIIAEMLRRGFTYHDWNVSSGDAASNHVPAEKIYAEVVENVRGRKKSVVLMHDSVAKNTTVEALPQIIETLLAEGYTFKALDPSVKPFTFAYTNY